jgi:hypothetical protein
MRAELFDTRQDLWRRLYASGLSYSEFIGNAPATHQQRWGQYRARMSLSAEQIALVGSFKRKMHIFVLAGSWCGDCARQCPMLEAIADQSTVIELRFFDNAVHVELANELRIHGASRVPVALLLSEDFYEVARFGDRTLFGYRLKVARELGAACDSGLLPAADEELKGELSEWLAVIERSQLLLRTSGLLRTRYKD